MKKSEFLKQVLVRTIFIASFRPQWAKNAFICTTLIRMGKELKEKTKARELRSWIRTLLHGSHTYNDWVKLHHPEIFVIMDSDTDAFNEGRIQWIVWMIKYWEEQGD